MKIYSDKDADLSVLRDKVIVQVGYGNQGKAFAQNLRDSGIDMTLALREKGDSIREATEAGFPIISHDDVHRSDIILLLVPDHVHGSYFDRYLKGKIRRDTALVFAHAYSIHFGAIRLSEGISAALVAPHGPGADLRKRYLDGTGLSCFVASSPPRSSSAMRTALAIARAIGCSRAGAFRTTFQHEAIGDLFGEQAFLCGGLITLAETAFETLVEKGLPPENAYLETVHQIELLAALLARRGTVGMMDAISMTAQYGTASSHDDLKTKAPVKSARKILDRISSGKFASDWKDEAEKGFPLLAGYRERLKKHLLCRTGETIRRKLRVESK